MQRRTHLRNLHGLVRYLLQYTVAGPLHYTREDTLYVFSRVQEVGIALVQAVDVPLRDVEKWQDSLAEFAQRVQTQAPPPLAIRPPSPPNDDDDAESGGHVFRRSSQSAPAAAGESERA